MLKNTDIFLLVIMCWITKPATKHVHRLTTEGLCAVKTKPDVWLHQVSGNASAVSDHLMEAGRDLVIIPGS